MHKSTARRLAWAACALALPAAGIPLLAIWLFSASDVERGSLAYHLGAPGHLRSVEIVQQCRRPLYQWQGRDGLSPPFTSVTYGSRQAPAELLRSYRAAFEKQSCAQRPAPSGPPISHQLDMDCTHADFTGVQVFIAPQAGCSEVTVDFSENY